MGKNIPHDFVSQFEALQQDVKIIHEKINMLLEKAKVKWDDKAEVFVGIVRQTTSPRDGSARSASASRCTSSDASAYAPHTRERIGPSYCSRTRTASMRPPLKCRTSVKPSRRSACLS